MKKTKQLLEYVEKISEWSKVRQLDDAPFENQIFKFLEEFGEIGNAVSRQNKELLEDAIGDSFVVLICLSTQLEKQVENKSTIPQILSEDLSIVYDIKYDSKLVPLKNITYCLSMLISEIISYNYVTSIDNSIPKYKRYTQHVYIQQLIVKTIKELIILANTLDLDFISCVGIAYEEIKDRKGILHNGTYIKLEDILSDKERYESEGLIIPKEWLE